MNKCPYCDENIQKGATKCRFCREWIAEVRNESLEATSVEDQSVADTEQKHSEDRRPVEIAVRPLKLQPLIRVPVHLFAAWMVGSFVYIFRGGQAEVGAIASLVASVSSFWYFERKPYSFSFACPGCGEAKEFSRTQMSKFKMSKRPPQCSVCSTIATIVDDGKVLTIRGEGNSGASLVSTNSPRWAKPSLTLTRSLTFIVVCVLSAAVYVLFRSGEGLGPPSARASSSEAKLSEETDYAKALKDQRQAVGDWLQYSSQDGSFQVLLPAQPEVLTDQDKQLVLRSTTPNLTVIVSRETLQADSSSFPVAEASEAAVNKLLEFANTSGFQVTASSLFERKPGGRVDCIKGNNKMVMTMALRGNFAYQIAFSFEATHDKQVEEQVKWCFASLKTKVD